jgi:uncharacterized membrane protein
MPCDRVELKHVPLFALLDDDEIGVLAAQVELKISMLAAIQAPVIMMSQNRQDKKDRLRSELDFDVNRRAESEIQNLSRKLTLVTDKLGDVDDLLRERRTPHAN